MHSMPTRATSPAEIRTSRHRQQSGMILGWGLLAAALLFYWASVAAIAPGATPGWNLDPDPDACEYFAAAVSLVTGDGYRIHLAGESLPPRYPPGYSLIQAAAMKLGTTPLDAPFQVNKWAGLGLILLSFGWIAWRGRFASAGLAALLMATFPAFIVTTRSPMSEPATALLSVLGLILLYEAMAKRNLSAAILGGFFLGLTTLFRISSLFMAGAFLLVPLGVAGLRGRRTAFLAAIASGLAAGLVPGGIYHQFAFGSPLVTGYHYWIPYYGRWSNAFSVDYLLTNLAYYGRELLELETTTTVASLYGEGSYLTAVLMLLSLIAWQVFRRQPLVRWFALCGALSFVPFLFYAFQEGRLIYPQLAALIPTIAVGVGTMLQTQQSGNRRTVSTVRIAIAALLLAQIAIFPGAHGDADFDRYLRGSRRVGRPLDYDLVAYLESVKLPGPVFVVTDLNPPYVYALLSGVRTVVPADDGSHYRWGRFHWGPDQRDLHLKRAVTEGHRVYLLLRPRGAGATPASPQLPEGWTWRILDEPPNGGRVAVADPIVSATPSISAVPEANALRNPVRSNRPPSLQTGADNTTG